MISTYSGKKDSPAKRKEKTTANYRTASSTICLNIFLVTMYSFLL